MSLWRDGVRSSMRLSMGGWKLSYCSPLPVEGEIFFLTSPFIDQALSQLCAFSSPDRRQGGELHLSLPPRCTMRPPH